MEIDLRQANEIFHDRESRVYDSKWGIRYDLENAERVRRKFEKLLKKAFPRVEKILEVGCGTGYVGLNLCLNKGLVGEFHACDISQRMIEACERNASMLGLNVKAKRSDLEALDYPDEEFDMVIGHAILHHVPDVRKALSEIFRVLRPGGICMLAGEPTKAGDLLGRIARSSTEKLMRAYASLGGYFGGSPARIRSGKDGGDDEVKSLESVVDVHTFNPPEVCRIAKSVGFKVARYEGEELVSSFVGWVTRTIENLLSEENLTFRWRYFSYTTYLKLSALDERIYPYIPSSWFYNMLLYLEKP